MYTINDATTAASPLVTDCQALSKSNIPKDQPWTPSKENSFSFNVHYGTCGFKALYNTNGSSMLPGNVAIESALVSGSLQHAIEHFAVDGRVKSKGTFLCLEPGFRTKTGWTNWEVYTVE